MYTASCIFIGIMAQATVLNLLKDRYNWTMVDVVFIGLAIVLAYIWS